MSKASSGKFKWPISSILVATDSFLPLSCIFFKFAFPIQCSQFNNFSLFSVIFQKMTMDMSKTDSINSVTGTASNASQISNHQLCAGCGKTIQDRYLLKALDMLWHEDCLKCGCCDCRLGEVGSTLYTKGNLMLCKRDYLRWVIHMPM